MKTRQVGSKLLWIKNGKANVVVATRRPSVMKLFFPADLFQHTPNNQTEGSELMKHMRVHKKKDG